MSNINYLHFKSALIGQTYVIYGNKIASRYIDYQLGYESMEYKFHIKDNVVYPIEGIHRLTQPESEWLYNYDTNNKESKKEFLNKFLFEPNNKEILVVYRNPFNRFKTALVQDTFSMYFILGKNDTSPLNLTDEEKIRIEDAKTCREETRKYLKSIYTKQHHEHIDDYIDNYLDVFSQTMDSGLDKDSLKKYTFLLKATLRKMLTDMLDNNTILFTPHNHEYLRPIVELYYSGIIDKNRFNFIDIDTPNELENILSNYTDKTKIQVGKKFTNKDFINVLDELLYEDFNLSQRVLRALISENFAYTMIKNIKLKKVI